MGLSYTVGSWTITDQVTDTVSTPKNLPVPDLTYGTDYAVSKNDTEEAVLVNITGASLASPESIRYGKSIVSDVYSGSDIPASQRHAVKSGVRTLSEVRFQLKAVNSVSGQEIFLPIRGWICLQLPTVNLITGSAVTYALARAVASSLNTGVVTNTREVEVARGDLIPT